MPTRHTNRTEIAMCIAVIIAIFLLLFIEVKYRMFLQSKLKEVEQKNSHIENALIGTSLILLFGNEEDRSRETHYKNHIITTKLTLNQNFEGTSRGHYHHMVEVWIGSGHEWHEMRYLTHSDILDRTLELEARARQYIDNKTATK
jgi:ABC-type multidrug transport system fused ATPase/permease subunit